MSLDISLYNAVKCPHCRGLVKGSYEEYTTNITHNLTKMAEEAGIYEALWRPHRLVEGYDIPKGNHDEEYEFESKTVIFAKDIVDILEKGLKDLEERPEYFKQFNSENGWGTYSHFVPFVREYLEECRNDENLIINVDR